MVLEKKGRAEETKSALDQELVFKASIKRNKLVGQRIGKNILSLQGEDLETFIDKAIDSDFEEFLTYGFGNITDNSVVAFLHWENLKVPFKINL